MELSREYPLGRPVSKETILDYLDCHSELKEQYEELDAARKTEFLGFCMGAAGLKICYDPVFKFVLDPEHHPERLSEFLSEILKQRVKVKRVLPREGERLLEKGSLVVMDVVVELEDGSLANVEIQKVGYAFPGERAACYSSDLVMRQYSGVRERNKKNFSYQDLKRVYTIVIVEMGTGEMHDYHEAYIHYGKQQFDTGLQVNLLQEYVFITLDVYKEIHHNKSIEQTLDAWLGFLSYDDPERIWEIQPKFPQFREMYQELAEFRRDIKEVLSMFSKELAILDRNTVKYMAEQDKAEIKRLRKELKENNRAMKRALKEKDSALKEKDALIESLKQQIGN